MRPCISHHYACDCREEMVRKVAVRLLIEHSPLEAGRCPCETCETAKKLLDCTVEADMEETVRAAGRDELLPCPFCGGMAEIITVPSDYYHEVKKIYVDDTTYYVMCRASDEQWCCLLGARPASEDMVDGGLEGEFKSKEEAASAWNIRGNNGGWHE